MNNVQNECQQKTTLRKRSSSDLSNSVICPVCTVTIRGSKSLKVHYEQEIDRFKKFSHNLCSKKKTSQRKPKDRREEGEHGYEINYNNLDIREKGLKNIKKNKYERYADMYILMNKEKQTKNASTSGNTGFESSYDLMRCPVCEEFLDASEESALKHLRKCFAKKEYEYDIYSSGEEETFEEFSWAGQTWIRASSLINNDVIYEEGKLTRIVMEDDEEELDVDGGNEELLGQQQFFEVDVIPGASDISCKKENQVLRDALICNEKENYQKSIESVYWNGCITEKEHNVENSSSGNLNNLVEPINAELNTVDNVVTKDIGKCPICLGAYVNPVVSTSCWHVCCSTCWLRTLGAKKLCPKCNSIVAPSQLRKIYL